MPSAKQAAVQRRREHIMDLMLSGATHADLVVHYNLFFPNLTEHSLEKDITWCYDNLKHYVNKNADDVINRHILYYDQIIRDSVNSPFKDTAIKAMQAKEKLLKLHNPDVAIQLNTQVNNVQLPELTVEQIKELLTKNE